MVSKIYPNSVKKIFVILIITKFNAIFLTQIINPLPDKSMTIITFIVAARCTIKDLIKDPQSGQKVATNHSNHDDDDDDDYT